MIFNHNITITSNAGHIVNETSNNVANDTISVTASENRISSRFDSSNVK
jgi:hypothetical protein